MKKKAQAIQSAREVIPETHIFSRTSLASALNVSQLTLKCIRLASTTESLNLTF